MKPHGEACTCELDLLRRECSAWRHKLGLQEARADAAEADATALAEALRKLKSSTQTLDSRLRHQAAIALAAHEKRVKP